MAASTKLALAITVGAVAWLLSALYLTAGVAPLVGWIIAATTFLSTTWGTVLQFDATLVKKHALREDPSRVMSDGLLLVAAVASLAAVVGALAGGSALPRGQQIAQMVLTVLSVVMSWLVVHTVYALRYAELYYTSPVGGVEFGDTRAPTYADFAYLAFTVGMTFQVSDTALNRRAFRRAALGQAFFAYLFGTVIIATTINLVVNLSR
jgi:uncharacterized membrane protein